MEHLPAREGLDVVAAACRPKVAGTEDIRDRAPGPLNLGDRFWGQGRAFWTERSVAHAEAALDNAVNTT
jgi:hypothetical protein